MRLVQILHAPAHKFEFPLGEMSSPIHLADRPLLLRLIRTALLTDEAICYTTTQSQFADRLGILLCFASGPARTPVRAFATVLLTHVAIKNA
jgi:hypothetical protein